jgi:hypothetical protein
VITELKAPPFQKYSRNGWHAKDEKEYRQLLIKLYPAFETPTQRLALEIASQSTTYANVAA